MSNTHIFRTLRLVFGALLAATLTACMSTTPAVDAEFGNAVRAARQAQILNPKAAVSTDPVLGMDGKAAASTMDRYQESFKTPSTTPGAMNIGGSLSGN